MAARNWALQHDDAAGSCFGEFDSMAGQSCTCRLASRSLVAVQPMWRGRADVPRRMDRRGCDHPLPASFRMPNRAGDFKLHLAFQDAHQFVRRVGEILPALARWVRPQITGKATPGPVGGDGVAVKFSHWRPPASGFLDYDNGGCNKQP